jgi:hypothetical protein
MLFEETENTLLCSDLFHQMGDNEPITSDDIVGRSCEAMKAYQAGILAEYVPYTPITAQNLKKACRSETEDARNHARIEFHG